MIKFYLLPLLLTVPTLLFAQLERKPAVANDKVELTFPAPRQMNLYTVEPLSKKELHYSIMHTFNTINSGIRDLYGLDNGANIRFSFEYGFSDRFSLSAGRSSLDKLYDLGFRYHLLQQKIDNSMPVSVTLAGNTAVNSVDYSFLSIPDYTFTDRMSYTAQLIIARKMSDKLSLQMSPMVSHFNRVGQELQIEGTQQTYLALGFSGYYNITRRLAITGQFIPNLNNDLNNNVGVGIDIETGGHVFQLYFVTSPALNEQYLLAGGNGVPGEEFRFGFNINRIFQTGSR